MIRTYTGETPERYEYLVFSDSQSVVAISDVDYPNVRIAADGDAPAHNVKGHVRLRFAIPESPNRRDIAIKKPMATQV